MKTYSIADPEHKRFRGILNIDSTGFVEWMHHTGIDYLDRRAAAELLRELRRSGHEICGYPRKKASS